MSTLNSGSSPNLGDVIEAGNNALSHPYLLGARWDTRQG